MHTPEHQSNEDIYNTLRTEILHLTLPPGAALSENEMAKRFGVSRTPIRSVFERLRSDQFIEVYPRRGTFVTLLDLDMIEQILYLRTCVESDILCTLAGSSDRLLLDKLSANLHMQKRQIEENAPPEEYYFTDSHFHQIFFKAAGKAKLWDILLNLEVHYTRYRILILKLLGNYDELYQQHCELVTLLRAGEKDIIAKKTEQHLQSAVMALKNRIANDLRGYFLPDERLD